MNEELRAQLGMLTDQCWQFYSFKCLSQYICSESGMLLYAFEHLTWITLYSPIMWTAKSAQADAGTYYIHSSLCTLICNLMMTQNEEQTNWVCFCPLSTNCPFGMHIE